MTEKGIQIAVARADLIVCQALRVLAAIAIFSAVLLAAVIAFRRCAHLEGYDPYWIDYDAPGVDITSEGP